MADRLKALQCEVANTEVRINDLNRIIEMKSNDLRAKQAALVEAQVELARVRDMNVKLRAECDMLRASNSKLDQENLECRQQLDCLQVKNAELSLAISKAEERLKGLEASLFCTQKDNECARRVNLDLTQLQQDKLKEKDALTSHVAVLTGQNGDLSKELSHFVE